MQRAAIRNKKGFTLVELMVAVAITLLVIVGSILSFVQLIFLADSSVNLTTAVNDAQYVLEQLKGVSYGAISGYTAPVFHNLPGETVALIRSVGVNLANLTVNVSWQEKNQTKSFSLSTCIAK
ncbi:MAG: prepilin-type N-terminal cleavage/methylation domain-containing protein [Candidatus Omnitrophica bacterium]|nr:prepilin-type N-terminal cleavage/methylation domain-containing protein [Candidatus Omnitrophota bacterium]